MIMIMHIIGYVPHSYFLLLSILLLVLKYTPGRCTKVDLMREEKQIYQCVSLKDKKIRSSPPPPPITLRLSVCLSLSLCLCLSVSLSVCLSVCLCVLDYFRWDMCVCRVCVRACVRACVCVCVSVCGWVGGCMFVRVPASACERLRT